MQTIETSGSQRRPQMHEAGQTQQLPKPARGLAEPEEEILLQTRCRYSEAVISNRHRWQSLEPQIGRVCF